jgi:putrescine aminotransferase
LGGEKALVNAKMAEYNLMQTYARHLNAGMAKVLGFMGMDSSAVRAEGTFVWDMRGRRFIDFLGGYGAFNFGHCHPYIIAAVREQLERMPLSCKLLVDEPAVVAAEKLARIMPGDVSKFFFTNSGTESVEGALKLARLASGRSGIIYTHGGFHGKTLGSLSATGRDKHRIPFEPLLANFTEVPFGDVEALEKALNKDIAAVILEPVQGEGGIHPAPEGYLKAVRELTHKHGTLLIADEVQTGMGRTGRNFACERDGIEPDIIVLAKSLGGGVMPVGAFGGTPEVWKKFEEQPLIHSSTFGGGPMACAAVSAAIDVLQEEKLADRAERISSAFLDNLRALKHKHPTVLKEARGIGLMIGLEFTSSDAAELAIAAILNKGVLIAFALNAPEVVRLEPPLNTPQELFAEVLEILDAALRETGDMLAQYS